MLLSGRKGIIDTARIRFKVCYLHKDRNLSGWPVHAIALIDGARPASSIPSFLFECVFQDAEPLTETLLGERAATPCGWYCQVKWNSRVLEAKSLVSRT